MSGIFLSYKKDDKDRVGRLVEGLRAESLPVWWDQDIPAGAPWDESIKREIEAASCIVAVWSSLSVTAPWVKEEAGHGKARDILVPVRIHDVDPPLGFGLIQAADLRNWRGDRTDPNWRGFVANVRKVLRGERIANLVAPQLGRQRLAGVVLTLLVAAVALTALGLTLLGPSAPKPVSADEQAAWALAVTAKSRAPFESYLKSYPGGRFADDAKAALSACRKTADGRTEPFERKLNVAGNTSAEAFSDRESAILSARDHGREQAERVCAEIAAAEKIDNMTARVEPANQPMCTPMGPKAVTCLQSMWATCKGQKRLETEREVCG